MTQTLTAAQIRTAKTEATKRDRDLAQSLGISEAALLAAHIGAEGALRTTRIRHHPDEVMPLLGRLGQVMSLTRNASVVHERVGAFGEYRSGPHAAMVLGREIDTRIFPKHWAYGFAVEAQTEKGLRRSLQFFDHYGEALHKVYLRDGSEHQEWAPLLEELRLDDQSPDITPLPAPAHDGAKGDVEKRDTLIAEWRRMTDTHQFNRLCAKLGMNRLGAYRMVDVDMARPVAVDAVETWLNAVAQSGQSVVLFVGNRGHIQIHWGPMKNIKPMGPWLNVLDPDFNLHLRSNRIGEVFVVNKPTKRGPAVSLEAFDQDGELMFQCFGERANDADDLSVWHGILDGLPSLRVGGAA